MAGAVGTVMVERRAGQASAARPLLVMTAEHDDVAATEEARMAGCRAVAIKPLTHAVVGATLRSVLRGGDGHNAAVAYIAPTAEQTLAQEYRGVRLLLVEDNPINLEVALELLREAGCAVDLAQDGAQAVTMAAATAYDLILMDVYMPVMDGLDATRAIRRLPGRETTPIVAMTANVFAEDRQRCLDAGMNDHVAKPIDPDNMFATLLRWLPKWEGARDAAVPVLPAAAGVDAEAAFLRGIPGLDVAFGLRTLRGRIASYVRLLRLYARAHGDDMARLRERCAAGDNTAAHLIAHSLKGASAMLGATRVRDLASELEQALREQHAADAVERLAAAADAALQPLIAGILTVLHSDEEAEGGAADRQQIEAALSRLESLLAADDIEASAAFRDALPLLRKALGAAADELGQQIGSFDFPAALACLRAVRSDWLKRIQVL